MLVAYPDPRTTPPRLSPPPQWPGEQKHHWVVNGELRPLARSLVRAVIRRYGAADGSLSLSALNLINRDFGADEDLDQDTINYLLEFNRGRFAPPRSLCPHGYVDFVAAWAEEDFDTCLSDLRKLGLHVRDGAAAGITPMAA